MAFRSTWLGREIARRIERAIEQGMTSEARAIAATLRSSIHKETGEMAARSFAEVRIGGGRHVLAAGSDAPHTVYEELGTSRRAGHPIIRLTIDRHAPNIPRQIAAALGGGR